SMASCLRPSEEGRCNAHARNPHSDDTELALRDPAPRRISQNRLRFPTSPTIKPETPRMRASLVLVSTAAALCATVLTSCGGASAQSGVFTLTSPDVPPGGTFAPQFIANGFGCTGGNVSPQLQWFFAPEGTQSFSLQILDHDAP